MNRRATIAAVCLAIVCGTLWRGAPATAQDDPVARSLQLTTTTGSLPLWQKPSQVARQELGNFVRSAQPGVVLVGHPKHGRGTAWVLSKQHRLLATNAHVADILHESQGAMLAVINGTASVCKVTGVWYHPGVRRQVSGPASVLRSLDPADGPVAPNCPDVAILKLGDGPELPVELEMAGPQVFEKLLAQPCAILGFAGHDTQSWPQLGEAAEASYHDGAVSRFTNFRNSINAPVSDRQFVQYTMSTWEGFSGSPVFLPSGEVVAIHNSASYLQGTAGDVRAIPHGIRIDCLWELIAHHGLDDRVPLPVDKSTLNVKRWFKDDPAEAALRNAVALVNEADVLIFDRQQFAEGANKCTEAIRLAPEYARAYASRSAAYVNYRYTYRKQITRETALEQLSFAERDARRYAQLDPTNPWTLISIAMVLGNQGAVSGDHSYNSRCIEIVNKLLQSDNLSVAARAEALSHRAGSYDVLDDDDQALKDHNEAIRLSPDFAQLYENRAGYWQNQNRSDLEEADMATARRLRSQRTEAP